LKIIKTTGAIKNVPPINPPQGHSLVFRKFTAAPASIGSSGHARAGSGRRDYVLIEQQADFVAWWDSEDGPGSRHGLNRFTIDNADPHSLSVERAEELIGIKQWQVSRWRTALPRALTC